MKRLGKVIILFAVVLFVSQVVFISGGQAEESVESYLKKDGKPSQLEETKNPSQIAGENEGNVGLRVGDFVKMIVATLFVVALLYFLLRFVNKKSRSFEHSRFIENLGGTSLGTNRSVQVIKLGNRILVVGVGENIELLTEIHDEDEFHQILDEYNQNLDQLAQPSDAISKLVYKLNRFRSTRQQQPKEFQMLLKNELKEMSEGRRKLYDEMEQKGNIDR